MNQYRITFRHPPYCVGEMVIELTGSVLVAATDAVTARRQFLREIVKRVELPIVAVEFVDTLEVPA